MNPDHIAYENVYVINLNSRPDRLTFMTEILNEIEQPFTRIEAVYGKELLESCMKKSISIHPKILYSCEDFLRDNMRNKCKPGEVGCWLSHLKLYFQIVENYENTGRDNPTLILEDDIDMEIDFKYLVKDRISQLPSDWELFYVGYFIPEEVEIINDNIAKVKQFWGTFAYIVRNAEVAKKLIFLSNKFECQVADMYYLDAIKRNKLISYHAYPQQLVGFYSKLGQDIEHHNTKDDPLWIAPLQNSTLQIIQKRKGDLPNNNIINSSDSKKSIDIPPANDIKSFSGMNGNELLSYHAYREQLVDFYSNLGQDIEHFNTKDDPKWIAPLQNSSLQTIPKRKDDLLNNNKINNSDSKKIIDIPPAYDLYSFSGNPDHRTYENAYVINLNLRPDRLAFITEILNEIQQPFTRFEAVYGKDFWESCKDDTMSIHPQIIYSCRDFYRDVISKRCLLGEIGCWLSHLKLHFQIVENYENTGKDNPTLILEDDVDLDLDFKKLVREIISHLPPDWEILYLGYFVPDNIQIINRITAKVGKFWGTFSYVVRNAQVAKKLIALGNKSECQIADHYNAEAMKRNELISYHAYPRQFAVFNAKLGGDIEHSHVKDETYSNTQLKKSTFKKINHRKNEL